MPAIFMALTDAQKLNQTRQTAASLQQAKDSTPGRRQGDVAAKITAYDATTGYYSWTEQAFDEDGVRYDKPEGLSGTPTYMPALALASAGDYSVTTFPSQVWLRPVIVSGTLGQIWEVLGNGAALEVSLPEKVCVTKVSGVVTDVVVQKATYQLWGIRIGNTTCAADEDCCPTQSLLCCDPPRDVPTRLTLEFTATGDFSWFDGLRVCYEYSQAITDLYRFNPTSTNATKVWVPVAWNRTPSASTTAVIGGVTYQQSQTWTSPTSMYFITGVLSICNGDPIFSWGNLYNVAAGPGLLWTCTSPPEGQGTLSITQDICDSDPFEATSNTITTANCGGVPTYTGTIFLTLRENVAGDCTEGPNPDPDPGACCVETSSLFMFVSGTGDFGDYGDGFTLTYDPTYVQSLLDAEFCPEIASKFQWYGRLLSAPGEPYFFFGCEDGVYYVGYLTDGSSGTGDFLKSACFSSPTIVPVDAGCGNFEFAYKAVDSHSCDGSVVANLLLTGSGTSGCSGTIQFTVYR